MNLGIVQKSHTTVKGYLEGMFFSSLEFYVNYHTIKASIAM